ncbi:cation:proton antiporter regulatory subunit [Salinicoccus bachuensis]|uniref:Cation:proton antiporter regulatory subunit n=1 Tax=Salinicoccus bachuensis TaxID=3136731 RepID=A0ABZ3CI19_9STAP
MKEQVLPGIGTKYSLTTTDGLNIVIVLHTNGKRELYIVNEDEDVDYNVALTSDEAKDVGLKLIDINHDTIDEEEFERFNIFREKKIMDWIKVRKGAPISGMTIEEAEDGDMDEISIVSVNRDEDIVPRPDASFEIMEGDVLLVVGEYDAIIEFEKRCKSGHG